MVANRRLYFFYGYCPSTYTLISMHISGPELQELTEVIEDTIEYFCDKEQISGELAWTVLNCLATAKIAELNGSLKATA